MEKKCDCSCHSGLTMNFVTCDCCKDRFIEIGVNDMGETPPEELKKELSVFFNKLSGDYLLQRIGKP